MSRDSILLGCESFGMRISRDLVPGFLITLASFMRWSLASEVRDTSITAISLLGEGDTVLRSCHCCTTDEKLVNSRQ